MSLAHYRSTIRFTGLVVILGLGLAFWVLHSMLLEKQRQTTGKQGAVTSRERPQNKLPASLEREEVIRRLFGGETELGAEADLNGDGLAEVLVTSSDKHFKRHKLTARAVVLSLTDTGWRTLLDTSDTTLWSLAPDQRDALNAALGLAAGTDPAPILAQLGRYRLQVTSLERLVIEPGVEVPTRPRIIFTWDGWRARFLPRLETTEQHGANEEPPTTAP